jgi:two-component system, NarL family, sensor histidine kinase DesK
MNASTIQWFRREDFRQTDDGPKRWRRGGGLWLFYLLSPFGSAWTHHQVAAEIAGTLLLIAFGWTYLFFVPLAWYGRGTVRTAYAIWGLLLSLAIAETAVIGANGLLALIFVGAAAMVILPSRAAIVSTVALAVLATVVPQYIRPWHLHALQWGSGSSIAFASLAVFGFSRLIRANHELAAAREEVAGLAAERERLRIARDLHDLLGHSLTTVTVKAELAGRLMESDPVRAKQEIADVERLAREGLADVRAAVAGYREVRLATELATARAVLAAAGIEAELPGGVDAVSPALGGLFGWVVREGVTNVVRHSRAQRVRISLDANAIEIVDDGQGCSGGVAGTGLAGLAERAAALGATLEAGPITSVGTPGFLEGFRLRVAVVPTGALAG